jgi:2-oxoglutarate ferredoxin oxidoreductase subunit alpha
VSAPISIDDVSIVVSGQGGDGSLTVTNMLGEMLRDRGMGVYTERDVLSRIKGGKAGAGLRASTRERLVVRDHLQVAILMDEEGLRAHGHRLGSDSVLLYDESDGPMPEGLVSEDAHVYPVPFGRLAVRRLGRILYKNSIATGVVTRVLSIPDDEARGAFRRRFKRLGDAVVDQNLKALDLGFEIADSLGFSSAGGYFELQRGDIGERLLMTGNEGIGLGFVVAGGRFFAGYPITPATDVLEFLQKHLPRFGGVAWQAEDELSSVNMGLGAALTGVRSMVGSSSPGIALMGEGITQAGSGEIPLVIIDTQRSGPSTGMPTKPEQSDINMVCFAGNGDFERIVLAAGDPQDCFWLTIDACNLAQRYQMPVFLITDQAVSQNMATVPEFNLDDVKIDVGKRLSAEDLEKIEKYGRYEITEDGVSPYTVPGTPGGVSLVTGNERDEFGLVSTDPGNRVQMAEKRQRKLKAAIPHLPKGRRIGPDDAAVGIIAIGAGYGACLDAVEIMAARGFQTQLLQPRTLWPVPEETLEFVAARDYVYVVEHNSTAQLAGLLTREGADRSKIRNLLRYDGLPIRPFSVANEILEREGLS